MSRELVKIKCFNAQQLAEAKSQYKGYSLVPVNKNGFKFVVLECWVEADELFSSNETKTEAAKEEQYY